MSPDEPKRSGGSGLSLQTLAISSLAAVAAAIVVPLFWQRGSLIATAISPIIVALVSAVLNRPAEKIKTVAPRVARRTATGAAVRVRTPSGVGARGDGPEQVTPHDGVSREDPFGLRVPESPRRRGPLKLALGTGLLAFVIGAGVVTASELTLFNHAVGKSGSQTGLFGGSTHHSAATPTPTPTATATATPSSSASPTPTPTPSASPTPTPSTGPSPTPTPGASPAPTVTPALSSTATPIP